MKFKTSMLIMNLKIGIKRYLDQRQDAKKKDRRRLKIEKKKCLKELKTLLQKRRKVKSVKNRILDLKWIIDIKAGQIKRYNIELKKNKTLWSPSSLYKELKKVGKSSHLLGIEATNDFFRIYTQSLIVRNKKIGSYEIQIPYSNIDNIKIFNLKKQEGSELQHWFVDEYGTPCFGDWDEGIDESLKRGDLGIVILNILRFLLSSYQSYNGHTEFRNFHINS